MRARTTSGAPCTLRDAGFDNVSLDLLYGIPGESPADLDADLADALSLEPEHLSCYELEAKPGTRFTHAHGAALAAQADALEGHFETVVDTLTAAGYRWYETANFCLDPARTSGRDLRARHNLGYWRGSDYLGVGMGAVSTVAGVRRRNAPGCIATWAGCSRAVGRLARSSTWNRRRGRERLLLGLRLDEPSRSPASRACSTGRRSGGSSVAGSSRSPRTGTARSSVSPAGAGSSAAA